MKRRRDREGQNVTTTTRESYEAFDWHRRRVNSSEHMEYKQQTGHSFGGKSGPRFPSSASLILTDIWTTSTLPRTVPGKCNQTNQRFCSSFPTLSFLRWMGNPRQSLLEPFYVYYFFFKSAGRQSTTAKTNPRAFYPCAAFGFLGPSSGPRRLGHSSEQHSWLLTSSDSREEHFKKN